MQRNQIFDTGRRACISRCHKENRSRDHCCRCREQKSKARTVCCYQIFGSAWDVPFAPPRDHRLEGDPESWHPSRVALLRNGGVSWPNSGPTAERTVCQSWFLPSPTRKLPLDAGSDGEVHWKVANRAARVFRPQGERNQVPME